MFHYFFNMVFLIIIPLHLYIGFRLWQTLSFYYPKLSRVYYWLAFIVLSSTFIITRFTGDILPTILNDTLSTFGYTWIVAMLYMFFVLVIFDIISLGIKLAGIRLRPRTKHQTRMIAIIVVIMVILYGGWNARTPRITHYDITIPKYAADINQLKVVVISDLHLGRVIGNTRLREMLEKVNELEPDLVLIPGDIIQDSQYFDEEKMYLEFQKLNPPLGIFASLGNHEFYGGVIKDTVGFLEQGGLKVLKDSYTKIANSFYIIGKDDPAAGRRGTANRPNLNMIMGGIPMVDRCFLPIF